MRQTAIREVQEETGCQLELKSLQLLGFLHLEHLVPPPDDYPYPHPDFLQLVFRGHASKPPRDDWQDSDGYVQRSWLETPAQARQLALDPVSLPFLDAFQDITKSASDLKIQATNTAEDSAQVSSESDNQRQNISPPPTPAHGHRRGDALTSCVRLSGSSGWSNGFLRSVVQLVCLVGNSVFISASGS